ncbi:Multicopper oxidase with three cupredoxin domains (includes cell division protein FtsP and spore coat protein CotA) [Microlunatus soli]|uniref:Copper-containing nitrite reductase n=2 Tax=Microlunatus soli TaxID=630515 RepID=A0A1H1WFG4_9ACTN|nr:Multicopper oxidase with three cupredoxin domains (includes cell division protein FtsP and spore coat protein CotA) [Microlunatus soli]
MAANLSEVLGPALMMIMAVAGYRIGQLAERRSALRLRRAVRRILIHLMINIVFLIMQIVLALMLWTVDWNFASNRIVLAVPAVLVPTVIMIVISVPRLFRLARSARVETAEAVTVLRRLAADPRTVVPAQLAAVGALIDCWVVFVDRPAPPYGSYAAGVWVILVAVAAALWVRQLRRRDGIGSPHDRRRPLWLRGVRAGSGIAAVALALLALFGYGTVTSRLPDRVSMNAMTDMDWGGGPAGMPGHATAGSGSATSVADLTGPRGVPDVHYTLVARAKIIRLSSGRVVRAWTFNGRVPGPELIMHQGDLVAITVINHLPGTAVTAHWHGLEVPNAEDGVPGVTQNAIRPGRSMTYRFRAEQVGSFWYHSHQVSAEAVVRGLFGPLVILPRHRARTGLDLSVMAHTWPTDHGNTEALGTHDTLTRRRVPAGTPVRLRLTNTRDNLTSDAGPRVLSFTGAPARVTAIDGNAVHEPGTLTDPRLPMPVGGRYDLEFTMPDHPVRLTDELAPTAGLVLTPGGGSIPPPAARTAPLFDPAHYGTPAPTPFGLHSHFDRSFRMILDDGPGFFDGHFQFPPTINGAVFPHTPMLMVRRGDLVETTFVDRGHMDHPMHLHGHTVLVLSHNNEPVTGSPWWTDTLEVRPGDVYRVAFRADNPGIWMDHCHNLKHAAQGMVMHLGYAGVSTPYAVGAGTVNHPR